MTEKPSDDAPERGGVPIDVRQQLLDRISPALEGLVDDDKRPEVVARLLPILQARISVKQTQVTETLHQGSLPPPDMLEHYDRVQPGMADRLLRMAERSQDAEIASVDDVNRRTDRYQLLALSAGFIGLIIILAFAYAMATTGHDWVAGGALGIGVSGIIATLVNAPFSSRRGRPDAGVGEEPG